MLVRSLDPNDFGNEKAKSSQTRRGNRGEERFLTGNSCRKVLDALLD